MTIHREGYRSITLAAIVLVLLNAFTFYLLYTDYSLVFFIFLAITFSLFLFIVSFFRLPKRNPVKGDRIITSPCDGKVVAIEEITDQEYFNDKRIQLSVFMSPANVHANSCPIGGEVLYSKYFPGKYLVAWHPKSSTENEHHSVVLKNENGVILVKQIAGALARRIVNYLNPSQKVEQGSELGFIKFGSRVDILLPPGTKINVKLQEKVKAGITVLAEF
jgi:phosphatidylserine decarboxylase